MCRLLPSRSSSWSGRLPPCSAKRRSKAAVSGQNISIRGVNDGLWKDYWCVTDAIILEVSLTVANASGSTYSTTGLDILFWQPSRWRPKRSVLSEVRLKIESPDTYNGRSCTDYAWYLRCRHHPSGRLAYGAILVLVGWGTHITNLKLVNFLLVFHLGRYFLSIVREWQSTNGDISIWQLIQKVP